MNAPSRFRSCCRFLLVSHDGLELGERALNESIGGAIDAEFVVLHEEPRFVDQILPQLIPKQDAPAQVRQIFIHPHIPPAEAAADQQP